MQERTEQSLRRILEVLTDCVHVEIRFVYCDMRKRNLKVVAEQVLQALHPLDRFDFMWNMNVAIGEARRKEVAQLRRDGYEQALTKSRWAVLHRPENLTDNQATRLAALLQHNLKSVRAHLLREEFQWLWGYTTPAWAGKCLESWRTRAPRSKPAPMKKLARSLRRYRSLNLNLLLAVGSISAGVVQGLSGMAKLTTKKTHGFRTQQGI